MIINIPSKEKTYTLVNDTVFDRNVLEFSSSATLFDKRFGSQEFLANPLSYGYFNSFDIKLNPSRGILDDAVLLQVLLSDITLSDMTRYVRASFSSKIDIRIWSKNVPTLGNLTFRYGTLKSVQTVANGVSPNNPHTIDIDIAYITGVVVPAGTTIKFSGYNMPDEVRRIEIVDSPEEYLRPASLMSPANKKIFSPFSKKVTFDLTIDQLNGMEVV